MSVPGGESTNDSCAADGRVDDGNHIGEFTLEGRVEVGTGLERGQAVAVGEFGKHADVAAVLELDAGCHDWGVCGSTVASGSCYWWFTGGAL